MRMTRVQAVTWIRKHMWIQWTTDTIFEGVVLDRDLPVHTPRFPHDNRS